MALYQKVGGTETKYVDTKKRTLMLDGVEWKRIPRPRPKSRNDRRNDVVAALRDVVQKLEDLKGETENESELNNERLAAVDSEADEAVGLIDTSEIESLKDELDTWKESIPENLQGGDKYSQLEEAVDNLENVSSELESVSYDHAFDKEATPEENAEAIAEAIQSVIDTIEEQINELENVEFPGMFG